MKEAVKKMCRAEERDVYVVDPVVIENDTIDDRFVNPAVMKMPGYKSIYNLGAPRNFDPETQAEQEYGVYASVVTTGYTLIQNPEAIEPFVDGMGAEGIDDFHMRIEETAKYANVVVMIDDEKFKILPKDGKPVWMGFRLSNGYDGKRSVYYGSWLMRADKDGKPDCSFNVTVPKDNKSGVTNSVNMPHRGEKEMVVEAARGYIKRVTEFGKKLVGKIDGAIDIPVADDMVVWILRAAGFGPRSSMSVKARYDSMPPEERGTMWSICVAIAHVVKNYHIERVGNASERIDYLLTNPGEAMDNAEELKLESEAFALAAAARAVMETKNAATL